MIALPPLLDGAYQLSGMLVVVAVPEERPVGAEGAVGLGAVATQSVVQAPSPTVPKKPLAG